MGSEDKVEQSIGRPFRQENGRSKQTCELTSSIVPRGTLFHRLVELEFPPIAFDPSLIGRMRSSAFRLSTITVSRSLASTRFSSESAPGPSIMGSEDEVEQSLGRPCPTAGPSGHANSPHPSSREGHYSTAWWSSSFLLSHLILSGS